MKDEKKEYPSKIKLIIRIAVSLYLFYIVWSLRETPFIYTGWQRILFIAAIIVFAAVGLGLCFVSARALMKGEYEQPEDKEEE